jgi:ABC-type antimicrobial peptide transport system permease subunit
MFFTYLRRELTKRSKQTVLISAGMAVAIALVLLVSGLSNGIKSAQATALSGLYGVGTDISVSKTEALGQGPQQFQIGADAGQKAGQSRTFSRSNLRTTPGIATMTTAEANAVAGEPGVKTSVATLKLDSVTFNGQLPTFTIGQQPGANSQPQPNATDSAGQANSNSQATAPKGGFDGKGGSQFDISRFSVEGVQTDNTKVGPLSAIKITSGSGFSSADAKSNVAILDSTYASGQSLTVGKSVKIASTSFKIIGIAQSTSATSSTASNVYIPLAVAQTLSSNEGAVTNIYVSAKDSGQIADLKNSIKKDVSGATVSTQADLAASVSGSLGTASSLARDMGGWLSAIVLLAAFLTAILFTTSGVNRRTREFGTLKAIGWRSNRIVRQVVGESIVNGLIGGAFGILLGLGGVWLINAFGPSLSASVAQASSGFMRPGGFAGPPGMQQQAENAMSIQLTASIEPYMFGLAIAFAIVGGLLAGAFGGLRAARLSPAEALRSVA